MVEAQRKAIIVGLSGASSSGKTTLARLLRDVFPNTFILHEDDFYKAETELPTRDGLLDWDCAESLNIDDMARALAYIRENASFPPFVDSKEDQNSIGQCPVSASTISSLKSQVASSPLVTSLLTGPSALKICLVDGFLLYSSALAPVMSQLDVRILLLVSRAKATQRREARDGYVTLEGFWADPPGYVDKIVWPNYVESHGWLFEGGDVEAPLKEAVLREEGILAQVGKGSDVDMETTFKWTCETLLKELERFARDD